MLSQGAASAVSFEFAGAQTAKALAGDELPGKVNIIHIIHGNDPKKWELGIPRTGMLRTAMSIPESMSFTTEVRASWNSTWRWQVWRGASADLPGYKERTEIGDGERRYRNVCPGGSTRVIHVAV